MQLLLKWIVGTAVAALLSGCSEACPYPQSPVKDRAEWAAELAVRKRLVTDGSRPITIKRDVHSFELPADADDVARRFHEVMRTPGLKFGMIEIDRPEAERGQPFHLSSRFQGRYVIEDSNPVLQHLAQWQPAKQAFCAVSNQTTSDYGVIVELDLPPQVRPVDAPAHPAPGTVFVLEYAYLVGSPIGGSSRFEVTQLSDNRSRLTQIFTYQETNASFAAFFANGGLTLHKQVVSSQVAKTAHALGVAIIATDMPAAYASP